MTQAARTITVTTRKRGWRTRLTITHPEHPPQSPPPGTPHYDTDRALELFTAPPPCPPPDTTSKSSSPNTATPSTHSSNHRPPVTGRITTGQYTIKLPSEQALAERTRRRARTRHSLEMSDA